MRPQLIAADNYWTTWEYDGYVMASMRPQLIAADNRQKQKKDAIGVESFNEAAAYSCG